MINRLFKQWVWLVIGLLGFIQQVQAEQKLWVIAHQQTPDMDIKTLSQLYLGKITEVNGVFLKPVNQVTTSGSRHAFFEQIMKQDEEKFIGYWIVRQSIGKGEPPKELSNDNQVWMFVKENVGSVGYVKALQAPQGVKIIVTLP